MPTPYGKKGAGKTPKTCQSKIGKDRYSAKKCSRPYGHEGYCKA